MLIDAGTPGRVERVSSHWPWPSTRGSITRCSAPEFAGKPLAATVAPVVPVVPWPVAPVPPASVLTTVVVPPLPRVARKTTLASAAPIARATRPMRAGVTQPRLGGGCHDGGCDDGCAAGAGAGVAAACDSGGVCQGTYAGGGVDGGGVDGGGVDGGGVDAYGGGVACDGWSEITVATLIGRLSASPNASAAASIIARQDG